MRITCILIYIYSIGLGIHQRGQDNPEDSGSDNNASEFTLFGSIFLLKTFIVKKIVLNKSGTFNDSRCGDSVNLITPGANSSDTEEHHTVRPHCFHIILLPYRRKEILKNQFEYFS